MDQFGLFEHDAIEESVEADVIGANLGSACVVPSRADVRRIRVLDRDITDADVDLSGTVDRVGRPEDTSVLNVLGCVRSPATRVSRSDRRCIPPRPTDDRLWMNGQE